MDFISSLDIPIKLNNYGYFLRLALNTLQGDNFDYLLKRLDNNKELEKNEGGYSVGSLGDNNPKEALKKLIIFLKENKPKTEQLVKSLNKIERNCIVITDREDIDFLYSQIPKKYKVVSNSELKRLIKTKEAQNKILLFYSFNGYKDFEFIDNLANDIKLILYKQEGALYNKQLQLHEKKLEEEITSDDRLTICGIKYEFLQETPVKVNPTLEKIIERIDKRTRTAYEGYKDESDSLLDDLEEQIIYEVTFSDNKTIELESNETVFDKNGNLIKSFKLRDGDAVRIYPKEQLAENLFQIAIDVEPDKFGKVEEHSKLWLNALKDLDNKLKDREILYKQLRNNGLKVLPTTVDAYFRGARKFPMFNCDLKAILILAGQEAIFGKVKETKRLYNSTMIALGRGIKQELKSFLKDNTLGDILHKRNFTKETLSKFIERKMPLKLIKNIQIINHDPTEE
ncbi:hypothetical protein Barb7_00589 [Bacteroidales bacterium Barb7]|nr:hypothetical protein Barb7_00589 [Bacteroidales bacterium Barb7]